MDTYAVHDYDLERTIVLLLVVWHLNLVGHPATLPLQNVHGSAKQLDGVSVFLEVSSPLLPSKSAQVLIQDLWKQGIGWDDQMEPRPLREQWTASWPH